jgi:hypothetical protein
MGSTAVRELKNSALDPQFFETTTEHESCGHLKEQLITPHEFIAISARTHFLQTQLAVPVFRHKRSPYCFRTAPAPSSFLSSWNHVFTNPKLLV